MAGHMITHSDNLIPVLHIRKMFYKKINEWIDLRWIINDWSSFSINNLTLNLIDL